MKLFWKLNSAVAAAPVGLLEEVAAWVWIGVRGPPAAEEAGCGCIASPGLLCWDEVEKVRWFTGSAISSMVEKTHTKSHTMPRWLRGTSQKKPSQNRGRGKS